jgi:membrane-bound lytic murein transglycosylase B
MHQIFKIILSILLFCLFSFSAFADQASFASWLENFKLQVQKEGVSQKTIKNALTDIKFLPKVIEYDRYQPEFYEDTHTYIKKRSSKSKVKKGLTLYKKKKNLINTVEKKYSVEKELLLALMGIETNFGNYLGKMDILSSLATLSYDMRRRDFFTNELIVLLKLIDNEVVDHSTLYGSWAGAFGNFQFMPSTIKKYAIDYDGNKNIDLKNIEDSFASAANYINSIGWKNNEPCFIKVNLKNNIPKKFLNTSAKKIKNKNKISFFAKFIKDDLNFLDKDFSVGIITPDKDIVADSENLKPAYIVFENYELILKWNRSLRFALAVCTLKNKFTNEI